MKIYRIQREVLVAVCDSDLVGNTYSSGEYRIEVREDFYGKEEVGEEEVAGALKNATIANITGEKAVKLAIKMGIIQKDNVLKIGECWHAQMVTL
ncbi:DUF424 domain-containing protein [Archaeoglobales archaeon]|nr:MAG: DUF424 domain-containing protein [Archaeoglobales archaeon]